MNKDLMRMAGFNKEIDLVEKGLCPFCGMHINQEDFRDELSKREFKISGLCFKCQQEIFGASEEAEGD